MQRSYNNSSLMGLGILDTPTDDWECFHWVNWHKHLVKTYRDAGYAEELAQQYAKTIFLTWWDKINTFWGSLNWCGYTSEFYSYFKSVGVTEHLSILAKVTAPIISATSNVAESAGNILTDAGKIGENASGAAGDVAKSAGNTAKVLKVLLPVTLVALASGAAYYVYKHFLKGDEKVKLPSASRPDVDSKPAGDGPNSSGKSQVLAGMKRKGGTKKVRTDRNSARSVRTQP